MIQDNATLNLAANDRSFKSIGGTKVVKLTSSPAVPSVKLMSEMEPLPFRVPVCKK